MNSKVFSLFKIIHVLVSILLLLTSIVYEFIFDTNILSLALSAVGFIFLIVYISIYCAKNEKIILLTSITLCWVGYFGIIVSGYFYSDSNLAGGFPLLLGPISSIGFILLVIYFIKTIYAWVFERRVKQSTSE